MHANFTSKKIVKRTIVPVVHRFSFFSTVKVFMALTAKPKQFYLKLDLFSCMRPREQKKIEMGSTYQAAEKSKSPQALLY